MSLAEILSTIASGGANVITGGIAGLAGIGVQRYFDLKTIEAKTEADKQHNAHELEVKKLEIESLHFAKTKELELANSDSEKAKDVAETEAFKIALNSEPQRFSESAKLTDGQNWLMVILDFVRGLVRPGLTAYLAVLTSLIYWQSMHVMTKEGMTMDPERAFNLVNECMGTVLFLFTSSTLFYFGTRNKASEARARKSF